MAQEPNDAWTRISPLDRIPFDATNRSQPEARATPGSVRFSMHLKGTQAIFFAGEGDDEVAVKFRYRRQAKAWQMFRSEGAKWVPDGPPSERAGKLLGQIVLVMQGADPRTVFETERAPGS